jgi:hypothetical protein
MDGSGAGTRRLQRWHADLERPTRACGEYQCWPGAHRLADDAVGAAASLAAASLEVEVSPDMMRVILAAGVMRRAGRACGLGPSYSFGAAALREWEHFRKGLASCLPTASTSKPTLNA